MRKYNTSSSELTPFSYKTLKTALTLCSMALYLVKLPSPMDLGQKLEEKSVHFRLRCKQSVGDIIHPCDCSCTLDQTRTSLFIRKSLKVRKINLQWWNIFCNLSEDKFSQVQWLNTYLTLTTRVNLEIKVWKRTMFCATALSCFSAVFVSWFILAISKCNLPPL